MTQAAGEPATSNAATSNADAAADGHLRVPLLELLTKGGCHLCDDARVVVAEVADNLGLPWHEVDIDDDENLTTRYGEEIPVVLVDGIQRDFWQIDPLRLRSILDRAAAGQ